MPWEPRSRDNPLAGHQLQPQAIPFSGDACCAAAQNKSCGPPPKAAVTNAMIANVGAAARDEWRSTLKCFRLAMSQAKARRKPSLCRIEHRTQSSAPRVVAQQAPLPFSAQPLGHCLRTVRLRGSPQLALNLLPQFALRLLGPLHHRRPRFQKLARTLE
jgi:hypothetical protein